MTEDHTQILHEAIEQHLEVHGPRRWKLVQDRFPGVSRATFWRHIKAIREVPAQQEGESAEQLPPPTTSERLFPPFFEPLEKLAEYERLLPQTEEMGRQAMNNQGKIINWRMYAKSVEMRRVILEEQIKAARLLLEMRRVQDLDDVATEALTAASPELTQDVLNRLRARQGRYPDIVK